jgi:hypothetical protein
MRGYRAAARPAQTCFAASCRKHPPQVITASNVRQIYKSFFRSWRAKSQVRVCLWPEAAVDGGLLFRRCQGVSRRL